MALNFDLLRNYPDFAIQYIKKTEPKSMPDTHFHEHFEIYYQLSGEKYYFIKDRSYYIKKGDIVIINKGIIHKTTYAGANVYERILINFKEEFISNIISKVVDIDLLDCFKKELFICNVPLKSQEYIETLLFEMINEFNNKLTGFNTCIKALMIKLLVFLNRYNYKNIEKFSSESPISMHSRISEITKYINEFYNTPINLDLLSSKFNMSPCYISRVFKSVVGLSFVDYLNLTRIKKSQKLLKGSKLTITDIAFEVGFQNTTHFERVFKSMLGVTPLRYRKSPLNY
jgi:AraC-like DNA-binding protein